MLETDLGRYAKEILKYQKNYGQRGKDSLNRWILRKRTINIAGMIITAVSKYDFVNFEVALHFHTNDARITHLMRSYESQMEDAIIDPEKFVRNLDAFFLKMCFYIEENQLYSDFFDFCTLVEFEQHTKIVQGHKELFDSYISMLMQQTIYFCRNRMEDNVAGISLSGELIFHKNPHPYSDLGSYELEKHILEGKRRLTSGMIYKAYLPYGYSFRDLDSAEHLDALVRVYDCNMFFMIPYINDNTINMMVEGPYQHLIMELPRYWKNTEYYKDALQYRNYILPSTGITMEFVNAADITKIMFAEVIHNEQVVMLYRVFTSENGEFSGFYNTKNQLFYSIFQYTNSSEQHYKTENFILECYMILTCNYEINIKKNYAIRQVNQFDGEFHYPYQPLAKISYEGPEKKSGVGSKRFHTYNKETYQEEVRNRDFMIRSLPDGWHSSEEAQQYAREMGYELPPGKTCVRPFQYRVHRKIASKNSTNK